MYFNIEIHIFMYFNIEIGILDKYIVECEVHWLVFIIQ